MPNTSSDWMRLGIFHFIVIIIIISFLLHNIVLLYPLHLVMYKHRKNFGSYSAKAVVLQFDKQLIIIIVIIIIIVVVIASNKAFSLSRAS